LKSKASEEMEAIPGLESTTIPRMLKMSELAMMMMTMQFRVRHPGSTKENRLTLHY
jgi:hypothetical protein